MKAGSKKAHLAGVKAAKTRARNKRLGRTTTKSRTKRTGGGVQMLVHGRVHCPSCGSSIRVKRKKRHISPAQKAAFRKRVNAAKRAGWIPFTKMTKAQKAAFRNP